jgi:hypothetical protein
MSDNTQRGATAELMLLLRNTEKSAREGQAALEATERLVVIGVGARFDCVEARLTGLERRMAAVETGIDAVERSNHRIEQMLIDISLRLP